MPDALVANLRRKIAITCFRNVWVFGRGTKEQTRLFCCALWVIWGSRNQMIHEKKATSGLDLSQKIQSYLMEVEGIRGSKITHALTEAE